MSALTLKVTVVAGTRVWIVILLVDTGRSVIVAVNIAVTIGASRVHALAVVSAAGGSVVIKMLVVGTGGGVVGGGAAAGVGIISRSSGIGTVAHCAVVPGAVGAVARGL